MAKIFGYNSPEEMINQVGNISELYVDSSSEGEFHRRINEEGEIKYWEYQVYRRDGSMIWVQEDTRAVKDRHGNLLYYEGIIQDISERKREEEALKKEVEDLKIVIDRQKIQSEAQAYEQEIDDVLKEVEAFDWDEDN